MSVLTLNLLINLRGVTTFVGTSLVKMAHALCLGGDDIKDCQLVAPTTRADNTRGLSVATMYRKLKAVGDDEAASTWLNTAIARARHRVWAQLEDCNPACVASIDNPMVVDIDATLIVVHPDKEQARANRGNYGYHPLVAAVDYGDQLGGEILHIMCRAGNAGANTATDHITMLSSILDAVGHSHGDGTPWGKRLAIRVDGAGGTKQFLQHLHDQKLGFIVGLPTTHWHAIPLPTIETSSVHRSFRILIHLNSITLKLLRIRLTGHNKQAAFPSSQLDSAHVHQQGVRSYRGSLAGAIFHSDHGSVYTSKDYRTLCTDYGVTQSMGKVGSSADNALAESFNATLKREVLRDARCFRSAVHARREVFAWCVRYNTQRRHSYCNYMTPQHYETTTCGNLPLTA